MHNVASNLLWSEGRIVLCIIFFLGIIGFYFFKPLFYFSLALFCFSFYFFRNPTRLCPETKDNDSVIVCPSDGRIVSISYDKQARFDGYTQRVSIFLSPFDVHVNWLPMSGTVRNIVYRSGTFSLAFLPKSSDYNERNDLILQGKKGRTLIVRQIAGTIARQICCWIRKGQQVMVGNKYGMIRFGSRVDILLPDNVAIAVKLNQKVVGGQTVLGYWRL